MTPAAEVEPNVAVDRATAFLEECVRSGDEKRIAKAQRAVDRAHASVAKKVEHDRRRLVAEQKHAAQKREAEKVAKKKLADQLESQLRFHEPFCEIHTDFGKVIRVSLAGATDVQPIGTTAIGRLCLAVANGWRDRLVATRALGVLQPAKDTVTPLLGYAEGVSLAVRHGLLSVFDED